MTALGIGMTDRDIIQFHDYRPGSAFLARSISSQMILANEQVDAAWADYSKAIDEYEDGKITTAVLSAFERVYNLAEAWSRHISASERYAVLTAGFINGNVTVEEQSAAFADMIEAGTVFRRM